MLDGLLTLEPADKGIFEAATQGTGAVECKRSHNVIFAAGTNFPQCGAHAWALNLKAANRCTCLYFLRGVGIVSRCGIQHSQGSLEMIGLILLDKFSYITHDSESADSQKINLDQSQCF